MQKPLIDQGLEQAAVQPLGASPANITHFAEERFSGE